MLHDYTEVTAAAIERETAAALAAADTLVDAAATSAASTYDDVLEPLEDASTLSGDAFGLWAFLGKVSPDAAVREAGVAAEERLTKWSSDLVFRKDLYDALTRYAASDDAAALGGERRKLLDEWVRDLRRTGHDLDDDAQERLKELKTRLIELEVAFNHNIDAVVDGLELTVEQLDGLPASYIEGLEERDGGKRFVSLAYPDYIPFMEQATDRDLRRRLQFLFWNRAAVENRPLMEEAVAIRQEIAGMLGYPSWAHYSTEVKMAAEPDAVDALWDSVLPGLTAMAHGELEVLTELLREDHPGEQVMPWDWTYLHNRQLRDRHGVDINQVARFFPLGQTIEGMFAITGEVFGLDYRRVENTGAWHPDVLLYEIRNRGEEEPIAWFYADLFPREGKYGHAAAFPLRYGRRQPDGSYRAPVAAIVANFTKPTATAPSLLKHDEVVTLFHEFGHILHFCLTTVDTYRFSGYDAEWDFVEAPSQIMENWVWDAGVLRRFARDYETAEPIPEDLVDRLVAARDLNAGLHNVRQIFLGKLDMDMHHDRVGDSLDEIYRDAYAYTLLPFHEGTFFPASFGHLMGGYDAGYYGYMWAHVYGDDMFSVFEEEGVLDPEVGRRYRDEVLATGGSRPAIEHLRAFLGREPDSRAFLERLGIG